MGATRPNKKRDEAASLLPPPPRDSLPTLLLLQPKYFDQLFSLLHTLSSLQCVDGVREDELCFDKLYNESTFLEFKGAGAFKESVGDSHTVANQSYSAERLPSTWLFK